MKNFIYFLAFLMSLETTLFSMDEKSVVKHEENECRTISTYYYTPLSDLLAETPTSEGHSLIPNLSPRTPLKQPSILDKAALISLYVASAKTYSLIPHEMGHYLSFRSLCNITPFLVVFGSGRNLFSTELFGTHWVFNLNNQFGVNFYYKNPYLAPWKEIVTSAAGPAMDFSASWAISFLNTYFVGKPCWSPYVDSINPGSIAERNGLLENDFIVSLNGNPIEDLLLECFPLLRKGNATLKIIRNGQMLEKDWENPEKEELLGIESNQVVFKKVKASEALSYANQEFIRNLKDSFLCYSYPFLSFNHLKNSLNQSGFSNKLCYFFMPPLFNKFTNAVSLSNLSWQQRFSYMLSMSSLTYMNSGFNNLIPVDERDGHQILQRLSKINLPIKLNINQPQIFGTLAGLYLKIFPNFWYSQIFGSRCTKKYH